MNCLIAENDHILQEAFNQLWQLQNQLQNFEVIQPGRRILKKGELLKICRKGTQARYFILVSVHLKTLKVESWLCSSPISMICHLP